MTPVAEMNNVVTDHTGKTFQSESQMCKAWGISVGTYQNRRKLGWDVERSLTTPVQAITRNGEIVNHKDNANVVQGTTRITEEEFLKRAAEKNPYIEVLGPFTGTHNYIHVRCRRCQQEYDMLASNLGYHEMYGCADCTRKHIAEVKTLTQEQFVEKVHKKLPYIEVLGTYSKAKDRILVRCSACMTEFAPLASSLLEGFGCAACSGRGLVKAIAADKTIKMIPRKTAEEQQEFANRIHQLSPNIEIVGPLLGGDFPVECRCLLCNSIFTVPHAKDLNRPRVGCPDCSYKEAIKGKVTSHEDFVRRLAKTHPNIEVLGYYKGSKFPIWVRCKTCNSEFYTVPNRIAWKGSQWGCKTCAERALGEKKRLSKEEFLQRCQKNSPDMIVVGDFRTTYDLIKLECRYCHSSIETIAANVMRGTSCPYCRSRGTSFAEQFLRHAFATILGDKNVLSRDTSVIGKELDIYIIPWNIAIEYGSWNWHKDKLDNDIEKRTLCDKEGIREYIIYSSFPEDEDTLFDNDAYYFTYDLGREDSKCTLKKLVHEISLNAGVNVEISEDEWEEIEKNAYLSSRRVTKEEFAEQLHAKYPSIEIEGEILSMKKPVKMTCSVCHYEWMGRPDRILSSKGCPQCSGYALTQEKLVQKVAEVNPELQIIGTLESSKEPILVKCLRCQRTFSRRAVYLMQPGASCPYCLPDIKRERTLAKRAAKFMEKYAETGDPDLEIIGDYRDMNTKILWRCRCCQTTGWSTPKHMLQGKACPNKANH